VGLRRREYSSPESLATKLERFSCELEIRRWGFSAQQETRTSFSLFDGRTDPLRDKSRQIQTNPEVRVQLDRRNLRNPPEIPKVLADLLQGSPKVCRPRASAQSLGDNLHRSLKAIYTSGKPKQRLKLKVWSRRISTSSFLISASSNARFIFSLFNSLRFHLSLKCRLLLVSILSLILHIRKALISFQDVPTSLIGA
jgi:hypothetical protein